ncbi:hypothetical protein EG329_010626 [Mollisiaceae sp. DMI_Dod_QoI]|nr:hypothetical protein EG329_010626 [Helotiales sp. DMI_Dod_QoI]
MASGSKEKLYFPSLAELEQSVLTNVIDVLVILHFEQYRIQGGIPTPQMTEKLVLAIQRQQFGRAETDMSNRAPYQTYNPNSVNIGANAASHVSGTLNINCLPPANTANASTETAQPTTAPTKTTTKKSFFYEVGPAAKACVTVMMESGVSVFKGYWEHKAAEHIANTRWWEKLIDVYSAGASYIPNSWQWGKW